VLAFANASAAMVQAVRLSRNIETPFEAVRRAAAVVSSR
jgi:hypothetical protein